MSVKRIRLIHDGDVVMNALGLVLAQEGYDVVEATQPSAMAEGEPNLVLIDRRTDGLSGRGAIADLKLQLNVNAPVYVFGSDSEDHLKQQAEYCGADGYVCTEWGFRRLLSVVRWALRPRPPEQAMHKPADLALHAMSRILIIDDHPGARERLVHELRNQGYHAEGSEDVPDFEAKMKVIDPDIIIADVVLKGSQGDELCRQLKARMGTKLVPIILISSLPEWELKERAQRAGADAYFRKQDGLPTLIHLLEGLLSEIVF